MSFCNKEFWAFPEIPERTKSSSTRHQEACTEAGVDDGLATLVRTAQRALSEVPRGPCLWLHESKELGERTVMTLKSPQRGSSSVLPALPGSYRVLTSELSPNVLQRNPSLVNTPVKGDGLR